MAITSSRVNLLTATPTLLAVAGHNATRIVIQNAGPNSSFVGGSTVATTTGFAIPAGTSNYVVPGRNTAVYAIAGTADQVSPANTSVLLELND